MIAPSSVSDAVPTRPHTAEEPKSAVRLTFTSFFPPSRSRAPVTPGDARTPTPDIYGTSGADTGAHDQDTPAPHGTGSSFASAQSRSASGSGARGSVSAKGIGNTGSKSVGGRGQQTPGSAARMSRIPQPQF